MRKCSKSIRMLTGVILALVLAPVGGLWVAEVLDTAAVVQPAQPRHPSMRMPNRRRMMQELVAPSYEQLIDEARAFPLPDNITETCNATIQQDGLTVLWLVTFGLTWYNQYGWNESIVFLPDGSITLNDNLTTCLKQTLNGTDIMLPGYCCWYGVECCTDFECGDYLDHYHCDCRTLGMVTALNLPRNNLTGELPDNWLNWVACEMKSVDFSFNGLFGKIDANISRMLNLEALALGYNHFSGALPGDLGQLPKLAVVDVTGNNLNGTIPMELCNGANGANLTDLLLANNNFSGRLNIASCNNLVQLDLTGNCMTGALPSFKGYFGLHILRLGNNDFNFSIPDSLAKAPLISDLIMPNNNLSGTIPDSISSMRLLSTLRLSNNSLTGTIPSHLLQNLGMLTRISLKSNKLTGTLPDISIQTSQSIAAMDFSFNSLVGTIPQSFKALAVPGVTVILTSNSLSCCGVGPKSGTELIAAQTIGDAYNAVNWTAAMNVQQLLPSYLAFSQFYVPVQANKGDEDTHMRCPGLRMTGPLDNANSTLDWSLDPSYFMYYNCQCEGGYQLANRTQPNKLWVLVCEPIPAPWYVIYFKEPWVIAVIVVAPCVLIIALLFLTCYRMGARPAFMQQYMNMRKRLQGEPREGTVTIVTTDIEGYSDLMKREPELMGKGLRIHNYCIDKARWQFYGYTMEQEGDSFILAFYEPFDAVAFCLQAQLLLQRVEWPEKLLNPEGGAERTSKGSRITQAMAGVSRLLMRERTSKERHSGSRKRGSHTSSSNAPTPPLDGQPSIILRQDSNAFQASASTTAPAVFNGLRVRMGVATGMMEKGMSLRSSAILERSKVVSDAAGGGQVLMDGRTFNEVKARLVELGAVDHNGLSLSKINLSHPTLMSWLFGRQRRPHDSDGAIALDMGKYERIAKEGAATPRTANNNITTATPFLRSPTEPGDDVAVVGVENCLSLYQIVSPALVERAHHFGSALALTKNEWKCIDRDYFSAPGTSCAAFGLDANSTIPAMTMVFCMVDGAKDWKLSRDKVRRVAIQRIVSNVLMNTLSVVNGGYMCRLQDDEFKYMAAFPDPERAAEWCLITQDAMMYQDWPEWLLKHEKAREERDCNGDVVFRGPRLRMGMCHGCPRAIVPDHNGRADYHGSSINSAARYMDAAAHGGQIVCEEETAMTILQVWNGDEGANAFDHLVHYPTSLNNMVAPSTANTLQTIDEITPAIRALGMGVSQRISPPPHLALAGFGSDPPPPASPLRHSGSLATPSTQDSLGTSPYSSTPWGMRPLRLGSNAASGPSYCSHTHDGLVQLTALPETLPSAPEGAGGSGGNMSASDQASMTGKSSSLPTTCSSYISSTDQGELYTTCPTCTARILLVRAPAPGTNAYGIHTLPMARTSTKDSIIRVDAVSHALGQPPVSSDATGSGTTGTTTAPSESTAASGPRPNTYSTSVSAYHLGRFKFKGSNDEISVVHLLLEAHAGRQFPSIPPRGKGWRTTEREGLAATSPVVELPDIGRTFYKHWCTRQLHRELTGVVSTSRQAIKGWAMDLLMATRRMSETHHRPRHLRMPGGVTRAMSSTPVAVVPGSGNSGPPVLSGSMGALSASPTSGARLMSEGLPAGTSSSGTRLPPLPPTRSDSMSSFMVAAEEGLTMTQLQMQQELVQLQPQRIDETVDQHGPASAPARVAVQEQNEGHIGIVMNATEKPKPLKGRGDSSMQVSFHS